MRVLVASHSYVLANTRGKLRALSQSIELTLVIPRYWTFELVSASAQPEPAGTMRLQACPTILSGHSIRYLYAPRVLWRVLRVARPDVVIVEEEASSLALAQFGLLKQFFQVRLYFFTWENIYWHPRLTRAVEWFNLHAADGAVAGNRDAVQVLRRKRFRKPVAVIPQMGVNTEHFTPPTDTLPVPPLIIGYVGRFVREKGLLVLWDALTTLEGNWQLRMVGNGPLRDELQMRADRLHWGGRVHWIEYIPRERLSTFFQSIHLLVLPSLTTAHWKEQFGRVLIEAMACGVPVIGSDSGAIPEVIEDAGLIVPEGDAIALREGIMKIMYREDVRRDLAARARRRVQENYDDDILGRNLYKFVAA